MACTVTSLKNASCVCTSRRVIGSGSMISMMRLLLSLSETSMRRNALVLSCASRLAIVAYDAALKMKKPSAATRGHETSGRMPQKSRSRLPRVITAEPSQAIASRTVPKLPLRVARRVRPVLTTLVSESHHHVTVPGRRVVRRPRAPAAGMGGGGSPQKGSVIRMITITGLFHPARHGTRRPGALHSRWFGRGRRRRNRGRELEARQIFENAIEIADLHRMLLHHGRHGSGELIDLPRSDTT